MGLQDIMQQKYEPASSNKFYEVGEVLELIVYDKTYPSIAEVKNTIKLYTDANQEEKINHKLLGITYKVAVINRKVNLASGTKESIDYNNLRISVVTYITSYNPSMIVRKSYGVRTVYIGLDLESSPNSPRTTYLLPSVNGANRSAKSAWEKIITAYDEASEEEVIKYYHNPILQKQYCMVNVENGKFVPVELDIGTTFIAKVWSVKDKFFNITSIEWDKHAKRSRIISLFNSKLNDTTVKLAKNIKTKLEDKRRDYASKETVSQLPETDIIIEEDDEFDKF